MLCVMLVQSAAPSRQLTRSASMRRVKRMFQLGHERDGQPAEQPPTDGGTTNIINVEPAADRMRSEFLYAFTN